MEMRVRWSEAMWQWAGDPIPDVGPGPIVTGAVRLQKRICHAAHSAFSPFLKNKQVALKDEDYATAKRLRDHPFMRLHTQMVDAEKVAWGVGFKSKGAALAPFGGLAGHWEFPD